MFDKPSLPLSIHTLVKLSVVHNEMRRRNPTMAEQDAQFVINKLCDIYLDNKKIN